MQQCFPIQVGFPAPPFDRTAVVDGRLKQVTLSSYGEANHWLILVFFPKAWSFICPTEIKAFSARLEEFLYSRSCAVVFASTDSEHCLKAWNGASDMEGGLGGVHIPLISDCNHRMSKEYGVLIEDEGVAQRALFIIDPKGAVRSVTVNDADVGRSVDETLRVLDALKFKDEFGEGCPVDWKRGDKGIDIASPNRIEGPVEIEPRRSWTDWVRPKLNRAWSGTSSNTPGALPTLHVHNRSTESSHLRTHSRPMERGPMSVSSHSQSGYSSGQHSPLVNPSTGYMSAGGSTSMMQAQLDRLLLQQRIDNAQAALLNEGHSIGMAN